VKTANVENLRKNGENVLVFVAGIGYISSMANTHTNMKPRPMTDREQLIRDIRRILADVGEARAWDMRVDEIKRAADYHLDVSDWRLAADETRKLRTILEQ